MKTITLSIVIYLLTTVGIFAQTYSGGDGSKETPYLISSKVDMEALATAVNDGNTYSEKYFLLTRNLIEVNDIVTTVIGDSNTKYFSGIFDGGEHVIALNINISDGVAGIFGYAKETFIKNLGVTGSVSVSGRSYAGGLCGIADNSTISDCHNTGSISGFYAGGLSGLCLNATITTNCYNTGSISGSSAGGLYGEAWADPIISRCYNTGSILGVNDSGGLCGMSGNGTISNCYNTGNVSSLYRSGGLCGLGPDIISNCYNTGEVSSISGDYSGDLHVAGICLGNADEISYCFAANPIITASLSDNTVGAALRIGRAYVIEGCYALSSMTLNGSIANSQDPTSDNGEDALLSDFQSQLWIQENLYWNFNDVWVMSDINSENKGLPILRPQSSTGIPVISVANEPLHNIRYFDLQGKALSKPSVGEIFIESGETHDGKIVSRKKLINK